ncbi:helix-turn-helix domain-containing protein [Lachnospiraceae bacterium 54-53]
MYRVLIIDDEDYVRDLLVRNIRSSSFEVEVVAVAGDGKEGLKEALSKKPDIVITDIAMPFMNGLELIKEMQKAGLHSKNVVISGYDEFEYAKQAISLGVKDYLLKPFLPRELNDVLMKMVQELDSQKALQQNMSLLKEQAVSREGLVREKALRALLKGKECQAAPDITLEGDFFAAGVMRLEGGTWDFGRQERVEEFLMLVQNGYLLPGVRMHAVSFDGIQLAVIWCGDGENGEHFLKTVDSSLKKIHASLEKYYHMQLNCAVGRAYTSQFDLEHSYREAMAVWRRNLDADSPILFYGEEKSGKEEMNSSQIREWKNQIRLSVRGGREEEALNALNGLMKCYASLSNKKNDYVSVSVGELVYAIQNDMEQEGYDRADTEPLSSMQDKITYGSLMDMKDMLASYMKKCCLVVRENSEETKAGAVVKQIKLMIENDLQNVELDLEWIAAKVHFSSSYVRQIFKQHTGESFGEYLIRKRMERAGKLLQKTSLKIQEIAEECGYENQRYFASSFKKFYGCTPTEFKKVVDEERLY